MQTVFKVFSGLFFQSLNIVKAAARQSESGLLQSQRFDMMGKKCSLITASPTKLLTDRHAIVASILY